MTVRTQPGFAVGRDGKMYPVTGLTRNDCEDHYFYNDPFGDAGGYWESERYPKPPGQLPPAAPPPARTALRGYSSAVASPRVIDFRDPPRDPFMFSIPYGPAKPWPKDRTATWIPLAYGRAALVPYELTASSTVMISPLGQTAQAQRKVMGTYGGQPLLTDYTEMQMGLSDWTEADADALDAAAKSKDKDAVTRLRKQRARFYGTAGKSWFHDLPTGAQVALALGGVALVMRLASAFGK